MEERNSQCFSSECIRHKIMSKIALCIILACLVLLLASIMPAGVARDSQKENATINQSTNETNNATDMLIGDAIRTDGEKIVIGNGRSASTGKVLRAGFEKVKAVNNLDVYGNRSEHAISSNVSALAPFDISQRVGNVSQFTYNTDIYKPIYSVEEYRRTKPSYQTPESLANRPVYNISGYPVIKSVNSIP